MLNLESDENRRVLENVGILNQFKQKINANGNKATVST